MLFCVLKIWIIRFYLNRVKKLGSFRKDNGDGNENVKKKRNKFILIKQNNNFARASRFFVHFFAVTARLRRENA